MNKTNINEYILLKMSNKSNFADRIQEIKNYLSFNTQKLAEELGYNSQEKISRLLRNPESAKPSFDLISDMAEKFKWLNVSWLITGNGKMLLDGDWYQGKYLENNYKVIEFEKDLKEKTITIRVLTEKIDQLETDLKECRETKINK